MLLGGYSSCQGCGCVPCKGCTAECTNPHTGDAFETVFTNYFEGVEVGNPSDGYLNASGDNDTSDPYDGMDGSGPWMQQVGGAFNDGGSYGGGTRFPCTYRFSFWRSVRGLGIGSSSTSTALTENVITLTVSEGAIVYPDGTVITPASGTVTLASVPLVTGGAGAVDPHINDGTVSFALQCQNVETTFSIQARIRWNVQKRQHTLYGIVRECYEEGTPCATVCSGSPPPSVLYLAISSATTTAGTFGGMIPNGTYAMDRIPGFCSSYNTWLTGCPEVSAYTSYASVNNTLGITSGGDVSLQYYIRGSAECGVFVFSGNSSSLVTPCGSGVLASGTGTWAWTPLSAGGTPAATGTLSWSVTA